MLTAGPRDFDHPLRNDARATRVSPLIVRGDTPSSVATSSKVSPMRSKVKPTCNVQAIVVVLLTVVSTASFFLGYARGEGNEVDTTALEARIDSLLSAGEFADALASAKELLSVRRADPGTRLYLIADAQRRIETTDFFSSLGPGAQQKIVEGYRLGEEAGEKYSRGEYSGAALATEKQLETWERFLGPEHPDVATSLNSLAVFYKTQARYAEAEPLYQRSLAIFEKALGPEHPDVATIVSNLALLYEAQGRLAEAEPLCRRSLAILEKTLGPEHPEVATSLNYLALLYQTQGRYAEAEPLYQRSLAIREKALGPDPDVATSLNNLAALYQTVGRYAGAELLYQRSLAIQEKALGPEHPEVATIVSNLALLYEAQGRYAEAEPLHQRSLAIREKTLGPEHAEVAASLNNLAGLYETQGRYAEAEPLYQRSLAIQEKALGPEHPEVATSLNNLAVLHAAQGRYAEAEQLYQRSLAIRKKTLGPDHPDVAGSLNNLALLYQDQGRYAEAEPLYQRSLAIQEKALGPEHPDVATIVSNLALLYAAQGRYAEAEPLCQRSLAIREKALDPEHPEVATSLNNLAMLSAEQGLYLEATALSLRAWRILQADFRRNGVVLAEPDALRYALHVRSVGGLYLGAYMTSDRQRSHVSNLGSAVEVALMSKGLISDTLYEGRRNIAASGDSTTFALLNALLAVRQLLERAVVLGTNSEADSLRQLERLLDTKLARRSIEHRSNEDVASVTAQRVAASLTPGVVLVEWLKFYRHTGRARFEPWYMAIIVGNGATQVVVDLGEAGQIDQQVARYRTHVAKLEARMRRADENDLMEYREIASSLYEKVWSPIERHIQGVDLVLLSPDGALNLVSFGGLWDPSAEKYLIEQHAIHYLSAGRDLLRYQYKDEPGTGLLAMGFPDYGATAKARKEKEGVQLASRGQARSGCGDIANIQWGPIFGTRREVKNIKSSWKKKSKEPVRAYTDAEASEDRFKAEGPGSRVIHLATHGYYLQKSCNPTVEVWSGFEEPRFVGENPLLLSGLALAGANLHGEGADIEGVENGILTAYEVAGMDLEGTELVVLSACETGLGTVEEGEGVYGLRRAFLMAGARRVVSALWQVRDLVTAEMMSKLYEQSDKPVYERMQDLQLERIHQLRKKKRPDHPLSWGAFVVIGDPN